MWIFSEKGFVSVVRHREKKSLLLIRGRVKEDVVEVIKLAEELSVLNFHLTEMKKSDYKYRVLIPEEVFKVVMARKIEDLQYDNFKSSIKDNVRHDAYMDIWAVMYNFGNDILHPFTKKGRKR